MGVVEHYLAFGLGLLAMSAATLSGRNFLRGSTARSDEIEAWLSLGATPARAHEEIVVRRSGSRCSRASWSRRSPDGRRTSQGVGPDCRQRGYGGQAAPKT